MALNGQDAKNGIKKLFVILSVLFNSGNDRKQPRPTKGNFMKANQLATLVLRLLGVYCLIVFVPMVPLFSSVLFYARSSNDASGMAAIILTVLFLFFWLGIGILLIVRSGPWGEKLTPKNTGEGNITAVSFEQIQTLAFAVAGVLIFSEALPQLLNSIFSFFTSLNQVTGRSQPPAYAEFNWQSLLAAIGILLKAALGLWLFFGAQGFANLWQSLRTFGTPKPPPGN
jgi:preprotein translocase subunit Sss1